MTIKSLKIVDTLTTEKQTYMISKNKDQFNDPEYLSCYKKKAQGQLIGMEALGWGAWVLLILVL
jgi:hypothetical protein